MNAARSRYEVLVGTVLSPAALAGFKIGLTPTVVPRATVYRVGVSVDSDIAEVVRRLTERKVELLEIRRYQDRPPPEPAPVGTSLRASDGVADDVVVPLFRPGAGAQGLPAARTGGPEPCGTPRDPAPVPISRPRPAGDGSAPHGRRRRRRAGRG